MLHTRQPDEVSSSHLLRRGVADGFRQIDWLESGSTGATLALEDALRESSFTGPVNAYSEPIYLRNVQRH